MVFGLRTSIVILKMFIHLSTDTTYLRVEFKITTQKLSKVFVIIVIENVEL